MKKKLFESIGRNKFKMKINEDAFGSDGPSGHDHHNYASNDTNPLEAAIQAMTLDQKNDPREILNALHKFFKEFGKGPNTISDANNILRDNNIDAGLVGDYFDDEAGASDNTDEI